MINGRLPTAPLLRRLRGWSRIAPSIAAVAILLATVVLKGAVAAEPKRVLMLHSFGREFAPFNEFSIMFREQLVRQWGQPIDIYEPSLETARFSDGREDGPFIDYLRALFDGRKLDLIVSIGGPAARFFQQHRATLFPTTPVLIAGTEQRVIEAVTLNTTDTVVPIALDVPAIVDNILQVLPETTTVAVVLGNSPLEKFWRLELEREFQRFADRVSFAWFNELSFEDIRRRAASLPPYSAILYTLFAMDADGVPQEQNHALSRLHADANAPIFSYIETFLGHGIVGGPLLSTQNIGRRSAGIAVRILRGEAPSDIKPPPMRLDRPVFDWRELKRWNISEARLPAGSEIRFRPPTMWEQYRWQLIAVMSAVLVQAAIIAWLLFERRRRRAAELESRRRLLQVVHLNRTAAAGALSASIAHELNQPLGAILSNAEAAELLLQAKTPDIGQLKDILADIREADQRAAEIIVHMRRLLKRRNESEIEKLDLNETIRSTVHILEPEAMKRGVALSVNGVPGVVRVRADQIHLQQVILNLAMNGMDAMLESVPGTRKIDVQTAVIGGAEIEVSVADSGAGIPSDKLKDVFDTFYTTKQYGTGLGLSIARTIVETYGGKIWAENRTGGGAVFRFTLPLSEPRPA